MPSRPNIILILTDDQGYGDLSAHGNPVLRTPQMDKLAGESVRFDNFVVSPSCSPTRCALMTGMHEFRSDVTHTVPGRDCMNLDSVTLAQVLKRVGYTTGMFGKWHLGMTEAFRPEKRGFDVAVTAVGDSQNSHFNPTLSRNGVEEKHVGYREDILFGQAMRFIDENKQTPFFCYLPTYSPHAPLVAPEEYVNRYKGKVTDQQAAFMGMLANIDDNIGNLMDYLKTSGLEKNTLVILMNDNGGTYGVDVWNAGMRGHKGNAWHGGTRALSFWHWPGVLRPHAVSELAGHVDVLPTLADLAGARLEKAHQAKLDGFSLVPMLAGQASPNPGRMIISHVGRWPSGTGKQHKYAFCGVHYQQYHLVRNAPCEDSNCRGECRFSRRIMKGVATDGYSTVKMDFHARVTPLGQWLLFDIRDDPAQDNDIAAKHPELVGKLSKAYDIWWDEVSVDFPQIAERTFEGVLQAVGKQPGKQPRNYILKLPTGAELPIRQPGVHTGYGWTEDKVPQLAPFDGTRVRLKALAYTETSGTKEVVVERVTAVERMDE